MSASESDVRMAAQVPSRESGDLRDRTYINIAAFALRRTIP